jgi:hypothetical protein
MAEYYYNGLGFIGDDYPRLVSYSRTLHGTPGAAGHDLLDQFETFEAVQHGFLRV